VLVGKTRKSFWGRVLFCGAASSCFWLAAADLPGQPAGLATSSSAHSEEYAVDSPEGPPSCVIQRAIKLVTEKASPEQFKKAMREVVSRTFDTRGVALFVLGRKYTVDPKDFGKFVEACMNMMIDSYAVWFKNRKNLTFKVHSPREKAKGIFEVSTEVFEIDENNAPKNPLIMLWTVKSENGTFCVSDVSAGGISMRELHRDVVAGLIKKKRSFKNFLKDFLKKVDEYPPAKKAANDDKSDKKKEQ
jgi:ABC-type transporter MlaC component